MKILGIDPGTTKTGWVIYDTDTHTVPYKGITENRELLYMLPSLSFDFVAIEDIMSYGRAVGASTFETCKWIGRFQQALIHIKNESETDIFKMYYKKTDINKAICFNGNAKDKDIASAIFDMFPKTGGGSNPTKGTKSQPGVLYGISSHMIAGLAVALTHCLINDLIERKVYT